MLQRWRQRREAQQALRDVREQYERFREEAEAAFAQLRAQRHDFLAHAGALQHMLEAGQVTEARDYLERLLGEYDGVNSGIRGEKAHVAAHLLQAIQRAGRRGVQLTLDLTAPLSALPMTPLDQSKLIANALDNALDAAEEAGDSAGAPFVKVTGMIGGGLYVLEIDNSTVPLSDELKDRLFHGYGLSTKSGDHRGFGTYIIASLVKRYNGSLEFSAVKDRFSLKIKVPIVK